MVLAHTSTTGPIGVGSREWVLTLESLDHSFVIGDETSNMDGSAATTGEEPVAGGREPTLEDARVVDRSNAEGPETRMT